MEYTKRRNLNRGYLKLEVWQRGMDLFEGYGRRSLPEYLQYRYTAKGSLAETFTRGCGLRRVHLITDADFEAFDQLHYEVENKLLHLISALESKRGTNEWQTSLPTHPVIHSSNNPPIP